MDQDCEPKSISRNEAKQRGRPYFTRSEAKRTLNSDGECSGSQSHAPPPKKLNQKEEAGKLLKIITDTTQGSSNIQPYEQSSQVIKCSQQLPLPPGGNPPEAETNGNDDESNSAAIALQNDLVLESLFSYMNRSDLLTSRLVNKQWQDEGAKELHRRKIVIRLRFVCSGNQSASKRNKKLNDICRVISECRTPSLLSSFVVKSVKTTSLCSARMRSLYAPVGNHMRSLTVSLNYTFTRKTTTFQKSTILTDLRNLLNYHVPNLENLEIYFDLPSHWKDQLQITDASDNYKNESDDFLLPKLKIFIVLGSPPLKFFTHVIQAAVNLKSLGGSFSTKDKFSTLIKYFMAPDGIDKIHLLKDLWFHDGGDDKWQDADFEILEAFLTTHKTKLELDTFSLLVHNMRAYAPSPRIVHIMNQILELSTGTLTKLRIELLILFHGLIIPRFPKLQEICIDCFWNPPVPPHYFFPSGFSMRNNFPNVFRLVFWNCSGGYRLAQFVNRLEITEPVPSIRHIIIVKERGRQEGGQSGLLLPPVSDFHHFFPNLVSVSYDNCYSYEI